jgi:hypothetical protein
MSERGTPAGAGEGREGGAMAQGKDIYITSMVGARTGEPAVSFRFGDQHVNMPLADARKVAMDLLSAALAAEQDAALIGYFREQGADDEQIVMLMATIREARKA